MTPEEEQLHVAYQVLGAHFGGFSAAYIQQVLEAHFCSNSDAGRQPMTMCEQTIPEERDFGAAKWTLRELRVFFRRIDEMASQGLLPPAKRMEVEMNWIKRNAKGKYYIASHEQLQQELDMQETMGIDPDGNLCVNGQIVKYRWLQSFNKPDDD